MTFVNKIEECYNDDKCYIIKKMNIIFIQRLIKLRKQEKLNQRQLAKAIGVNQSAISLWERGARTPDIDTLLKIADFFKVSTDYLLGKQD